MPLTKAQWTRIAIIDECLRSKGWTKAELLTYVNRRLQAMAKAEISPSQLRYDLSDMQGEYGAPIEQKRKGRAVYYFYDDPEFSVKEIPVSEDAIIKLNEAVQILRQIQGMRIGDELAEIVEGLERKYKYTSDKSQVIYFEDTPFIEGTEYLEDIYKAIQQKNTLKISHKKHHGQPKSYTISPYLLKEYMGRWYLLGYSEDSEAPRTFALDRIIDIRVSNVAYRENEIITNETYFKDVIGVTTGWEPEQINLWFSPAIAQFILSKPLHHSQFIESNDGKGLLIQLVVVVNPELISLILSYGAECQVIGPETLVNKIKETIEKMREVY